MCGINGIIGALTGEQGTERVSRMNDAMTHRGPDAAGIFADNGIALGHRRLSIIDLDPRSNQPFYSPDRRYVMVFNGEIYNYKIIRNALTFNNWTTESDTEVLLHAYIQWGSRCLDMLEGMFAFAIWDCEKRELFVARDRMGIKPLYYCHAKADFAFSSEIRALMHSGIAGGKINTEALPDYLMYHTIHAPETIIKGVYMLMPGHCIRVSDGAITAEEYWNPETLVKTIQPTAAEAQEQVRYLLTEAVKKRLVADVPFGAFLSGGIDSSAVVALMAGNMSRPVDTFNIAFDESEFSEAKYARLMAEKYGTRHHEIVIRPESFLKQIPDALNDADHPGADGINTWVVSKAAKEAGVTMVLSGLGGDEFFGGYDVFKQLYRLESKKWVMSFPRPLRALAGNLMKTMKPGVASQKMAALLVQDYWYLEYTYRFSRMSVMEKDVAKLLSDKKRFANSVYNIVLQNCGTESAGERFHLFTRISLAEMRTYLHNVLLRDTDQMSMAHALEVRVPFLDHTLVEYLISLPQELKISRHAPKELLIKSLGDLLPHELVHRPKMGFTFPWAHWLKTDLKDFCETHLNALATRPEFDKQGINQLWTAFKAGKPEARWANIWNLVVLEHYLQKNGLS
jgi:asparagine synthase (glutamine-hydrolysing)